MMGKLTNKDDFGKLNINVGWSTKYVPMWALNLSELISNLSAE